MVAPPVTVESLTAESLRELLTLTLPIYEAPGQALWRAFELAKVRELRETVGYDGPVLEIGCSDGVFSSLVFDTVDDGIDINPRAIERAKLRGHVYERLHVMDARRMAFPEGAYGTVFANCVIEHIPDLEQVLRDSFRVLRPGGKFVATVPLREMNDYLVLRQDWYARMRQRQLVHVNLLSEAEWQALFRRVGFGHVETSTYLRGSQCAVWDQLDLPVSVGVGGRYNVGAVLRILGRRLPARAKRHLLRTTAARLAEIAARPASGAPCATAIVAWKR